MKFRLRISRAILLISLGILFVSVGNEALNSYRVYTSAIESFRNSEINLTLSTAKTVEEALLTSEPKEVANILPGLIELTKSQLSVMDAQGKALVPPLGSPAAPVPADVMAQIHAQPAITRWNPDNSRLRIWVALKTFGNLKPAILFREVDLNQEVNQRKMDIFLRILTSFLVGGLMGGFVLLVNWRLAVGPLEQMQKAAERVVEGDLYQRLSEQPIVELDNIGSTFNRMLDRIQAQTRDLEKLNRRLETTVENRTLELETANTSLRRHARGLEVLNKILAAAAAISSLQELVDTTLVEIVQALEADSGLLRILEVEAVVGMNEPMTAAEPQLPGGLLQRMIENGTLTGLAVPILAHGIVSGRILIGSTHPDLWSEEDEALLHVLGQQIGAAAERINVYGQTRETNRMMARLISASEQLNQQHSLEELVEVIGRSALDLAGCLRGAFFILGQEQDYTPIWHTGVSQRFIHNLVLSGREQRAFNPPDDLHPAQVPDTDQLPGRASEWWRQNGEGIRSSSLIPLLYEGRISAYFACFYDSPGLPGYTHPEILEAFARQAATALENTRLIAAERKQRVLAEALRDVTAALTSTLVPDEVFERILINLGEVIPHDAASLMMIEDEQLHVIRGHGYPTATGRPVERSLPLDLFPHVLKMLKTREIAIIPDTRQNPDWVITPDTEWIASYAGAPVCARGNLIGIINLIGRRTDAFSPDQAPILQIFADQSAIAIENAQIYQVTRRQVSESTTLFRALTVLLSPGGDVDEIMERIVRTVVNELHVGNCGIFVVDRAAGLLRMAYEAGITTMGQAQLPSDGPGLIAAALAGGETIYAADVHQNPDYLEGSPETQSELVIPLRSNGTIFALLNMEHNQLDAFDAETRQTLASFTERAALVLENARLLESAREQSRRSDVLNAIARAALESSDIQATLNQIVAEAADLIHAEGCLITLWDAAGVGGEPAAAWGLGADAFLQLRTSGPRSDLAVTILRKAKPLVIGEFPPSSKNPIRALLGVPLMADGLPLGGILAGYTHPHSFSSAEIGLLEYAAVQVALGIAKIRSLEATRKQAETSEKLRKATAALTTHLDFEEVSQRIEAHLASLIPFDCLAVFLVQGGALVSAALSGEEAGRTADRLELPLEDPLFLDLCAEKKPVLLLDAQKDPRFLNLKATFAARAWAGVPFFAGEQVIGSIGIGRRGPAPFLPDEILLFQVFANQAGAALQNALLLAREQQLAITDPLTGLYNRRGFFELARHELESSWRFDRPLALLMLDIDHFKAVNDTYGHPAGDEVLRVLSTRIRDALRDVDLICRIGGEEFCIMLPESSAEGAHGAAERLRLAICEEPITVRAFTIPITISIGLTHPTVVTQTIDDLIDIADRALLNAKQGGRNQVCEAY